MGANNLGCLPNSNLIEVHHRWMRTIMAKFAKHDVVLQKSFGDVLFIDGQDRVGVTRCLPATPAIMMERAGDWGPTDYLVHSTFLQAGGTSWVVYVNAHSKIGTPVTKSRINRHKIGTDGQGRHTSKKALVDATHFLHRVELNDVDPTLELCDCKRYAHMLVCPHHLVAQNVVGLCDLQEMRRVCRVANKKRGRPALEG